MKFIKSNRTKEEIEQDCASWTEQKVNMGLLDIHSVCLIPGRETRHFILPFANSQGQEMYEVWFTEKEIEFMFNSYKGLVHEKIGKDKTKARNSKRVPPRKGGASEGR